MQIPDGPGHNDTRGYLPSCHYDHAHQVSAHNQQYYMGNHHLSDILILLSIWSILLLVFYLSYFPCLSGWRIHSKLWCNQNYNATGCLVKALLWWINVLSVLKAGPVWCVCITLFLTRMIFYLFKLILLLFHMKQAFTEFNPELDNKMTY